MRVLRGIWVRAWLRRFVLLILIGLAIAAGVLLGDYELPELTTELITLIVFIVLGIMAVVSAFVSEWLSGENGGIDTKAWWADFTQGLSTEMVGALLTGVLFVFVVGAVEERQAEDQWKKELIFEMGSPNNVVAVEAARTLEAEGWLEDGSLQGADLTGANLEKANLIGANLADVILADAYLHRTRLSRANLIGADLQGADLKEIFLTDANLAEAKLGNTHLQGARLSRADLHEADLQGADLEGAILTGADLSRATLTGADLSSANLSEADLTNANLDNVTWLVEGGVAAMLPDGSRWTPDTDLGRFTDPAHANFWRSDNPDSPAYAGESTDE